MNIVLVPWTWARHFTVAVSTATAALLTWWAFLVFSVWVAPVIQFGFRQGAEGAALLSFAAGAIAGTSMLAETSLRRQSIVFRIALPFGASFVAWLLTLIGYGMFELIFSSLASKEMEPLVTDPSFTSLRYRFLEWGTAGLASGFAPLLARIGMSRKIFGNGIFDHLAGGLGAGLLGAATWHFFGYYGIAFLGVPPDLYLASAFGIFVWGLAHGLLVWGIPRELYASWVRVLSPHRFGHRIPIDRLDGKPTERFLGHYPRGLDMFLAAEKGCAELHVSFVSDGAQNYAIRGLSQAPITVKRPLEAVDLRYDPRRPAPLETELEPEDRIFLGSGAAQTELEFLFLPKEES